MAMMIDPMRIKGIRISCMKIVMIMFMICCMSLIKRTLSDSEENCCTLAREKVWILA